MEKWKGLERRDYTQGCPLHDAVVRDFATGDKRMERYEKKIDDLLAGQNDQALAIQHLVDTFNNGLRGDLTRTMAAVTTIEKRMTDICQDYEDRLQVIEDFKWFRDFATDFRNHLFKNLFKLAIAGSILYLLTHFGDMVVKKLLGI